MFFPLILRYIKEKKKKIFYDNLGKRSVIIYFTACSKVFKINLQLNIYNILGKYGVIIHITI